jgi:hypothetical protein
MLSTGRVSEGIGTVNSQRMTIEEGPKRVG